jgi:hypothetical protein
MTEPVTATADEAPEKVHGAGRLVAETRAAAAGGRRAIR